MKLAGVLPWLVLLLAIVSLAVLFWRSQAARDWIVGTAFVVNLRLRPRLFRLKMWIKRFLRIQGRELPKRRGLSAHHHSGKVLAHHHTSYASLAFLLMISTVLLAAYSATSRADVSSSQLLTFTVLGPPPTSVPTIDQPVSGDHTTSSLITVQGTCDSQLLVELYRNGSFAGSIACSSGGTYSLLASLVNGQNDLTVRHVDGLGQAGPSSAVVSVFYDAPPPPTPTPTPSATPTPTPSSSVAPVSPTPVATNRPAASATPRPTAAPAAPPLTIDSDQHYYQGGQPGSPIDITITVKGGYGPYSTSWDWGDGSEQSIATSNGKAVASHAYKGGGMYRLVIRAEDSRHHEAVITLQVIVNGGAAAGVVGQAGGGELSGNLMIAWPLLAMVILMVASFWLGENHRLAQVRFARLRQRRLSPGIA